jgi:hypothetical protein
VARFLLLGDRAVCPAFIGEKEFAMRRVLWMVPVLLVLGMVGTAQAQRIRMTADLSGANETPAPGVLTGSYGRAVVIVDIGERNVSWEIDVFNMPSGTNNAHFHVGGPGIAGPTVINIPFPSNASNDYRLSGSATAASTLRPDQGLRSWDDVLQSIVGGQMYINIHSAVNAGGEIRGQLLFDRVQ